MNKLLVICGPTATGKTKLAQFLAHRFTGELISADSRQVYRGMDIGTGKDLPKELRIKNYELRIQFEKKNYTLKPYEIDGIWVWLYDVAEPNEVFNVAQYEKLSRGVIDDIQKRGKLPIVVGGTGLYIKAITQIIQTLEIPPDLNLRYKLQKLSLTELQAKLKHMSLQTWFRLNDSDRQNPRRLIRKIELTKRGKIQAMASDPKPKYDLLTIGLIASHDILYRHIDARVEQRLKEGILAEIQTLLANGYGWDLPSMSGLGYRQWKSFFKMLKLKSQNTKQKINRQKRKIVQQWKYDEHAYARRQLTWFNKQPGIRWFDISRPGYRKKVEQAVAAWYTHA